MNEKVKDYPTIWNGIPLLTPATLALYDHIVDLLNEVERLQGEVELWKDWPTKITGLRYCKEHKTICLPFNDQLPCCLEASLKRLREGIDGLNKIVLDQADDESIWFIAEDAPEEYLQHSLRILHFAIEKCYKKLEKER